MDEVVIEPKGSHEPEGVRTPKKAAIAAWIGSVLEYYDFFIYGTAAALVFPSIFFPQGNQTVATIASLATFGVGYVARPVGAFFMGHLGDKFGRKRVLIATLILMGVSTFAIGLLPTYSQVGALAPALLVLLRLLQGFSASGEQAGANSLTLEHAPPGRRAYYSSFTLSGTQAGSILAIAVFLIAHLAPPRHFCESPHSDGGSTSASCRRIPAWARALPRACSDAVSLPSPS